MERNIINWVELPVTDMPRAKKFYSAVFNMQLTDMPSAHMEMATFPGKMEGMGSTGALVKSDNHQPGKQGALVYFECEDCNTEADRIATSGGKIMMPKMSIGEWGHIAVAEDTEGNAIGLHSMN